MAKFQALYIFNFAKNTSWPMEDANKDLVITIIGDNELTKELKTLAAAKKIMNRNVVVRSAASVATVGKSDIVCLGEAKSEQINVVVNHQEGSKSLIVSSKQGHCANGAGIAFTNNNGKLGFEISDKNIQKNGLRIDRRLMDLGTEVY
ncbi:MAG: YfiR family protein [Bacteroidales bacterium]|nr:YfiR family protein [Bacteroidales bacterium]